MTAKTMAEVLAEHRYDAEKRTLHQHCTCGWFGKVLADDFAAHQAAALSAAGFGLVADAKAEAWDHGFASGKSRAMRAMSDEPSLPLTAPNPYRDPS
jgi:hypothetical protein